MKKIFLLGVGRNTPVFIDLAEQSGFEVVGLYHYNELKTGEMDYGYQIIGSFKDLYSEALADRNFLLTMGDNIIRTRVANKIRSLGGITPNIIHPTAVISRFAKILNGGVVISAFSHIQAFSEIEIDTIVLSGVNISHNSVIGRACFIAGGATIGAYTTLDDYVFIGQGTLTISGKVARIGKEAYIGAGSLVTKSIMPGSIVAGRPAKPLSAKGDNRMTGDTH